METTRQVEQRFSDGDGICPSYPSFLLPAAGCWAVPLVRVTQETCPVELMSLLRAFVLNSQDLAR